MKWFDRKFRFDLSPALLPNVVERLRGTPARLDERLGAVDPGRLTAPPPDGDWSIQENAGHLLDLEPLWRGRVEDLIDGRPELRAADLTNRLTYEAGHNSRKIAEILRDFREARGALVALVENLDEEAAAREALHPRLGQPMRLIDHLWFVAEHDDHHLARIAALLREEGGAEGAARRGKK